MANDRRQGPRGGNGPPEDEWQATPEWLEKQAQVARDRLRAMPYHLLSPSGKILRDMIDREDAELPRELPENVVALSEHPRFRTARATPETEPHG